MKSFLEFEKDKIINGEIAVLEIANKESTDNKVFTVEDFRDLVGCQENIGIMSDCITFLQGNQLNDGKNLYRLVQGRKLVINMFEQYANYFIDAINDGIEEGDI